MSFRVFSEWFRVFFKLKFARVQETPNAHVLVPKTNRTSRYCPGQRFRTDNCHCNGPAKLRGDTGFFFFAAVACVRARLLVMAFFTTSRAPSSAVAIAQKSGQQALHAATATELA